MAGDEPPRYTPCNGVLLNWEAKHPIIAAALKDVDDHYDPLCWGCLGPRLFGYKLSRCSLLWKDDIRSDDRGRKLHG